MIAVIGMGLMSGASAEEVTASWQDTSTVGTTLATIDFDTVTWRADQDAELRRVMRGIGDVLQQTPNGQSVDRGRIAALMIDPMVIDRSRLNLGYCHYTNGDWSVTATTAYSARFVNRAVDQSAIPFPEQYVYTNRDGFREPAVMMSDSLNTRCDSDGINRTDRTAGWVWSRAAGLMQSRGNSDLLVVSESRYDAFRTEPWAENARDTSAYASARNTDTRTIMQAVGRGLTASPNGQSITTAELQKANINPKALDRSRHNLAFCSYSNGDWSVSAASAGARVHPDDLRYQYVLTNRHGMRNPTEPMSASLDPVCAADGINATPSTAGWLWHRLVGEQVTVQYRDAAEVVPEDAYEHYRARPWAWESE